jgi:uncharacterized protein
MTSPLISCLLVTRQRLEMAKRAIDLYAAQDYQPRELVIVSDGREEFEALDEHARRVCRTEVKSTWVERGSLTLGALRNLSMDLATGDVICQWDDDDLSHPSRLSTQYAQMHREGASASFLTDHLLWEIPTRSLYWCDWARPRGIALGAATLPCTVMCERSAAPRYPEAGPMARRSEDALFMRSLFKRGSVAKVSGYGWLYVYVVHGGNTWDDSHYRRIVQATAIEAGELDRRRDQLREAMKTYGLASGVTVRDHLGVPVELGTVPAGGFSRWLRLTDAKVRSGEGVDVPCGSCNVCCRSWMLITIKPEETETIRRIPPGILFSPPGLPAGQLVMGHRLNGQCPMLVDDRCSIYEHRPLTCRNYDCRTHAATGLSPDSEAQPALARRTRDWVFEHDTADSREAQRLLRNAAAFLHDKRQLFPEGILPIHANQLASLALRLRALVGLVASFPDSVAVQAIVSAIGQLKRQGYVDPSAIVAALPQGRREEDCVVTN